MLTREHLSAVVLTKEEALTIYYAGPEAVIEAVCDLSRQVDLR